MQMVPQVGLEPTTLILQGSCTANCAIVALVEMQGVEPWSCLAYFLNSLYLQFPNTYTIYCVY